MFELWLSQELKTRFEIADVIVIIDEEKNLRDYLDCVTVDCPIYYADSDLEELHAKYLIEKNRKPNDKFLVYTCRRKDDLKFIREYCETEELIEISLLHRYIISLAEKYLHVKISLKQDEILSFLDFVKRNIGGNEKAWYNLEHKGSAGFYDMTDDLLPFLHNPRKFDESFGDNDSELFYRKVNEFIKQKYVKKPAATLAKEVVYKLFETLIYGKHNKDMQELYANWLNSKEYSSSIFNYLKDYKLPLLQDIWSVNPEHPFADIDNLWLEDIVHYLQKNESIPQEKILAIEKRVKSKYFENWDATYWKDILTLLEFNLDDIHHLSSLDECIVYFTVSFYKIDTAIRNLYTKFYPHNNDVLLPIQEQYEHYLSLFYDKWFSFFPNYQENQTGILHRILRSHDTKPNEKTAIIVSDGLAYELAEMIAQKIEKSGLQYELTKDVICADIPSETENNMSRIYCGAHEIESQKSRREKYLATENGGDISFVDLEKVNSAYHSKYLICTSKDIDSLGEKLQQKGLRYFEESINFVASKIQNMLDFGYSNVYLLTDHGFVLTGILNDSDKINVSISGENLKAERYIRTAEKQNKIPGSFVEFERDYQNYHYLYCAKSAKPFKTKSPYGYSHGGITPQELITPCFCWSQSKNSVSELKVSIKNKGELKHVTGNIYSLILSADNTSPIDLFSIYRKVIIVSYNNGKHISTSDIITLERDSEIKKEFSFEKFDEIDVEILDAQTKERLDETIVKRSNDRDFGGLF